MHCTALRTTSHQLHSSTSISHHTQNLTELNANVLVFLHEGEGEFEENDLQAMLTDDEDESDEEDEEEDEEEDDEQQEGEEEPGECRGVVASPCAHLSTLLQPHLSVHLWTPAACSTHSSLSPPHLNAVDTPSPRT